jgi:hypothetical protein
VKRFVAGMAVVAVIAVGTMTADAASIAVSCPGTASTTDRAVTVTTNTGAAACLVFGTGNIDGNNDPINHLGYVTLDTSDDATTGALPGSLTVTPLPSGRSGSFSISAPGYTNWVVAFKSGEGTLDPDWAAFVLPAGGFSGSWSISGPQRLSDVDLYGVLSSVQLPLAVPLPSATSLLLSSIATMALIGKRRQSHLRSSVI